MNPSKGQTWQARKSGIRFIILTAGPKQVTMRDLDGNKRTVKRSSLVKSYRPYVYDNGKDEGLRAWNTLNEMVVQWGESDPIYLSKPNKDTTQRYEHLPRERWTDDKTGEVLNELPPRKVPVDEHRSTARAFAKSTKPKPQSLIPKHPKYGYKVPQPAKTERGKQAQEQAEVAVWQQWGSPSTFTPAASGSSTYDNWTGGSFDVVAGDPTLQAKVEPKPSHNVWDKLLTPFNCILFVVVLTALGIWLAS